MKKFKTLLTSLLLSATLVLVPLTSTHAFPTMENGYAMDHNYGETYYMNQYQSVDTGVTELKLTKDDPKKDERFIPIGTPYSIRIPKGKTFKAFLDNEFPVYTVSNKDGSLYCEVYGIMFNEVECESNFKKYYVKKSHNIYISPVRNKYTEVFVTDGNNAIMLKFPQGSKNIDAVIKGIDNLSADSPFKPSLQKNAAHHPYDHDVYVYKGGALLKTINPSKNGSVRKTNNDYVPPAPAPVQPVVNYTYTEKPQIPQATMFYTPSVVDYEIYYRQMKAYENERGIHANDAFYNDMIMNLSNYYYKSTEKWPAGYNPNY